MYFAIKSAVGGYRAYFYGANHEIVWHTETYTAKSSAQHAIDLAKAHAPDALVYDWS